ncbi:MAG: pilus assembly protein PilY [Desulfuromonadales bacterium]|nr:pilus assembly protein PilY [Desulfuromonadales bacterium]
MKVNSTVFSITCSVAMLMLMAISVSPASAAVMNDYCSVPPFVSASSPPLVLIVGSKDHKFNYTAYSDSADLDEDGKIDADYKHSIDYYGYFDPVKCYTYDSSASGSDLDTTNNGFFKPVGFSPLVANSNDTAYSKATYGHEYTKFCAAGQWSGNVLNWLTMTRMDVLRKVLYGGHRSRDTSGAGYSTMLERTFVPRDAHSWAKEMSGRLCRTLAPSASKPKYTTSCITSAECETNIGYTECDDVSNQLIGFAQAPLPTACSSAVTVNTAIDGLMLVARYQHSSAFPSSIDNGNTNTDIVTSFDPLSLIDYFTVGSFADTRLDPNLNSSPDHANIMVTTEFKFPIADASPASSTTGAGWRFVVDSDDGADATLINTTTSAQLVVASFYGPHGACFPTAGGPVGEPLTNACAGMTTTPISTTLNTTTGIGSNFVMSADPTWYRLIVRQTNGIGQSGVRLWYKKPTDSATDPWRIFGVPVPAVAGDGNFKNTQFRRYNITTSNVCSLKTDNFIASGQPTSTAVSQQRHIFCSTTDTTDNSAYGVTGNFRPGPPLLKLVKNSTLRLWDWGAKQAPLCDFPFDGVSNGTTSGTKSGSQYIVRVKSCDPNFFDPATNYEKCKKYVNASNVATWKPIGLLQKYGEGQKNTNICSRTFTKTCTTDADCTTATEGLCVPVSQMYFGLMTGSYTNNLSGGVLRKDITSITDEINQDTGVFNYNSSVTTRPAVKPQGEIIRTYERLGIVGFDGSNYTATPAYSGGCTPFVRMENNAVGQCRDWGNPLAEIMYEGLRYLAGKASPDTNYAATDSWIGPNQPWGIAKTSTSTPLLQPYGTTDGTTPDPSDPLMLKRENALFPRCSKPFMLVLSDINSSYDGDKLPGSSYSTMTEDANKPTLNFNAANLLNIIGSAELINGTNQFIGQSLATNNDDLCSSKNASSNFSFLRGLCPEEPTRRGTYYAAAVSYYGATLLPYRIDASGNKLNDGTAAPNGPRLRKSGVPSITTYAVPIASPIPELKVKLGTGKTIGLVPFGKSIYWTGGSDFAANCWNKCTKTIDADGLRMTSCASDAYCGGQQIVPIYVNDIRYDTSHNLTYADFRINFEDSEQGNDHDMDSVIGYELCTKASVTAGNGSGCKVCSLTNATYPKRCNVDADCGTGEGTCNGATLASDQVMVTLNSQFSSAGIDSALGFVITGTSGSRVNGTANDGVYMPIRNNENHGTPPQTGSGVGGVGLPLKWTKVFTASSTNVQLLHDPLWYAAKWGGFQDKNAPSDLTALTTYVAKPDDAKEWANNCPYIQGLTPDTVPGSYYNTQLAKCDPDNYYLVVNPLKLETQLNKALNDILTKVASGTASSILNNSEGSGANLLQAVFYPQKNFSSDSKVDWIGEMQNLWYYLDPFFQLSTVRVDSNSDFSLDLKQDNIAKFRFDTEQNQTVVDLIQDTKGDGSVLSTPTTYGSDDPNVLSLWRAGRLLWERNLTSDPRKIYTVTNPAAGSPLTLMANNGTFNTNATVINLLQASTTDSGVEAGKILDYLNGDDQPLSGYRSRTVTISGCGLADVLGCTRTWKLGDIINSTPRLESSVRLNTYNSQPPAGYSDSSYNSFINSHNYTHRGMTFVGANDGLLHAFKLGILNVKNQTKFHKARIDNFDDTQATAASHLGREEWAFAPRNVLPYLKYMADPNYSHLFYVDNTATLFDASIHAPSDTAIGSCNAANYWNCEKKTDVDTSKILDMNKTSWRTILIGGMGFGGASRNSTTPTFALGGCDDKVSTGTCVKTPIAGVGYSSYFALDVTNPHVLPGTNATEDVKFLWEFNGDPANNDYLGYTTSGPAIVRIGPKDRNGQWYAVFASGPTGPIDNASRSFLGKSDQNLKIFIVDLVSGALLRTIDTGITKAFAGSISGAVSDNDRWNNAATGFYSDDVVHIGYVQVDTSVTPNTWTKGGVLRLTTKENPDPSQWVLSTVIDNIGPVTTSVTKLQDRFGVYDKTKVAAATGKLWLYFGTGRYFNKADALDKPYQLFGIEEPCYSNNIGSPNFTPVGPKNKIDPSCTKSVSIGDLQSQNGNATTSALKTLPLTARGWYVDLDTSALNDGFSSERVVTNPVASTAGAVFFTTFRPTPDICKYGGDSYIWALKYDSGAEPPAAAMQGKAIMQVSTGALAEISLADAFKSSTNNKRYDNRRIDHPISGMPPSGVGLLLVTNPKPVKKMLHYQEN